MYFIFLILTSLNVINCEMPSNSFDVVVYGSSPAGIAAAVAAGRLGMKVALLEPLKMIGGMGAAGNLALNDGGTTL
jgi:2-polyprenyl-6-methoxyphenol hydroxylase-like FAD-dependent oxidoreductase